MLSSGASETGVLVLKSLLVLVEEEARSLLRAWATNLAFKMLIAAKASSQRRLLKSKRFTFDLVHAHVFNLI